MATEIERKFLVVGEDWRGAVVSSTRYRQGYLTPGPGRCSVRVRVGGGRARLNIKGATVGVSRPEYEYAIPVDEAEEMLDALCSGPLVEKTRHLVDHGGHRWEIDVFEGENAGLVVAEVELTDPDEALELPAWAGEDVSGQVRYYNAALAETPYSRWPDR